ncbi:sugar ABC transporter permease [Sulfobacillus sp. DSM 109850]|uniref:Sugar ABC transporter permease n=2 Tax=Sulfobacillus harzensis TaxID=2729629 RepID=A0A7Y0Q5A4_9FIRM|nr:sugar ABC transporter permease [Sulfobacillus harzensis]
MNWQRWVLTLPGLLFFVIFALAPMVVAVYYSGLNWNGIGTSQWVGIQNWIHALSNGAVFHALRLTAELMVLSWFFQNPLSLALGVFMAGRQKYRAVYSVIYFVPLLFSSVAIGVTWSYILNPNFGLLDALLKIVGLGNGQQNWLGNPHWALLVVAGVIAWQFIPFNSLLYHGGAKQIPDSLYEAARLDGASPWQSFLHVTIPQLKNTMVTTTILNLTGTLTYFDLIYVLTSGGPGDSTNVLAMEMYKQAFYYQNIGMGSVIAVVMAVAGLVLSILTVKFTGFSRMDSQMEGM